MRHRYNALWIVALIAAMLVMVGCAGIQPYEARNHREEGPQKGLFTGSQGEWVILGPKAPETGGEEEKNGGQESETKRQEKKDPANPAPSEQQ